MEKQHRGDEKPARRTQSHGRASPYTREGQRGTSSTEGEVDTNKARDRPTSVALTNRGSPVNDVEISTRTWMYESARERLLQYFCTIVSLCWIAC